MALIRKAVGDPQKYRGSIITVTLMGPDYLGYVDGNELSGFYITPNAAAAAGQRYVDEQYKAKKKA